MSYHNRGAFVSVKIRSLFSHLSTQTYNEVAPTIGFWTELALTQQFVTVEELVEQVSDPIWDGQRAPASFARFLKEFRDSPHRSAQAKSFVDEVCTRIFRWFVAAPAEELQINSNGGMVARCGANGFIGAASLIGHFIECRLLDHEVVRLYLIKPLTHHYPRPVESVGVVRANAIFRLFAVAGNTLLQGLLEPEDVRTCFEILETRFSRPSGIVGLSATKLEELRELHATWLQRKDELEQRDVAETEEREGKESEVATEIPAEVKTPIAFAPQDLPTIINIGAPSSISQGIKPSSDLHDVGPPSDASADDCIASVSSPTLSISTVSDLTPTEFDEGISEGSGGRIPTRHETFYLEDGNIEIVCGHTIFRIHSPIVSFSSPNLRDMLSPSTLLSAPTPEGCPRVTFNDNAEDFAVLLKMIYTPGFPARNKVPKFTIFASLLRMTAKYGPSDLREALVEDLKGAYPTRWEDFEAAKVLGEDIFGSPKPHPSAVLNLFTEQRIKFALPFAAYRAGLGGPSALASERPSTVLPRLTLASIIHGMGEMGRSTAFFGPTIAYNWDLGVCTEVTCVLNVGTNRTEQRKEALNKISDALVEQSGGDMLSSLPLENLLCAGCADMLKDGHRDYRRKFVWAKLPSLLGWESWEGV